MPDQPFKFTINNGRNAYVYIRPRLLDRSLPQLGVYVNGELVEVIDFTYSALQNIIARVSTTWGLPKKSFYRKILTVPIMSCVL